MFRLTMVTSGSEASITRWFLFLGSFYVGASRYDVLQFYSQYGGHGVLFYSKEGERFEGI